MKIRQYVRQAACAFCVLLGINIAAIEFLPKHNPTVSESPDFFQVTEQDNAQESDIGQDQPNTIVLTVSPGDTFAKLLKQQGVSGSQIHYIAQALGKLYRPQNMKPGHSITLTMDKPDDCDSDFELVEMRVRPDLSHEIVVVKNEDGKFVANRRDVELLKETKWVEGSIQGSLYEDALRKGIPKQLINDMIKAYSYDVDFQRGLQNGDEFGLMFSTFIDPETQQQIPGEIMHATLNVRKKRYDIYRFNKQGFYNGDGQSVRKGLLRTPVNGARLSSRFGKRRHPILGYTKYHKGVDFAAPKGTPIMAAGDGTIDRIGYNGSYGHYVRIRHNGEYSTAYGHLSRYNNRLKRGMPVKQAEVIGYIGATGRATGPHLHYEVIKYNRQINPLNVTALPAGKLTGSQLAQFNKFKEQVEREREEIRMREEQQIETAMNS